MKSEFGRRGGIGITLVYRTPISHLALVSPQQGADTLVFLASTPPGEAWRSGGYYARRRPGRPHPQALDQELAERLWERSAGLVGLASVALHRVVGDGMHHCLHEAPSAISTSWIRTDR